MSFSYEKQKIFALFLLLFHGIGTFVFWIVFFSGGAHATEDPIYMAFESAFPLADTWMAINELLAAFFLIKEKRYYVLFALLAAGAIIFLGCMDLLFNIEHQLYAYGSEGAVIELFVEGITFATGIYIIIFTWKNIEKFMEEKRS